ncbi:MAG: hypothetical protein K2L45_09435 [Muribaculaceae bacterium]|nr:hypothetical protein [Muribaculaceae bacterium]
MIVNTRYITPIRDWVTERQGKEQADYYVAPLFDFPKFGIELEDLFLLFNKSTQKLQLWGMPKNIGNPDHSSRDIQYTEIIKGLKYKSAFRILPYEFDDISILIDDSLNLTSFIIENESRAALWISCPTIQKYEKWFDDVQDVEYGKYLVSEHGESFLLDRFGQIYSSLGTLRFQRMIDEDAFIVESSEGLSIRNGKGDILISKIVPRFERLTDRTHYLSCKDGQYSIHDCNGKMISGPYDKILNHNDRYITAKRDNQFFLLDLTGKNLLESLEFRTITRAFWRGLP